MTKIHKLCQTKRLLNGLAVSFCFLCASLYSITPARAETLPVVSSFSILTDLIEQVGGEQVDVYTLIRPEQDAHTFEPSARDAHQLAKAKLIFANGLGFEPWLKRLRDASGFKGKTVIVSDGVTALESAEHHDHEHENEHHHHDEHGHGEYDPHAWQNVRNVMIYVENIADALIQADPEHTHLYQARAQMYLKELDALDAYIFSSVKQIPENRRIIVTSHHSFAYFADHYGFATFNISGVDNETLSSAVDIKALIQEVRHRQIPALFLEEGLNPRSLEQVSRETQTRIGGHLYSDTLSNKNKPSSTYIKMMYNNVSTLMDALQ